MALKIKYISKFLTLSLLFFILSESKLLSQRIDTPDGEVVIRTLVLNISGEQHRLTATNRTIYTSVWSPVNGWGDNKKQFMAPIGVIIVDIAPLSGDPGIKRSIHVLLNNGDTYNFIYNSVTSAFEENHRIEPASITGTGTYKKLFSSNKLYLHFSSRLYVNQKDGNGWRLDSNNIRGHSINDISLNPLLGIIAATNHGLFVLPLNDTNWHRINGFDSTINCSSVFTSRDGRILVGTSSKGTFISLTNSVTWIYDTTGIGNLAITKFGDDGSGNIYSIGSSNANRLYRRTLSSNRWIRIDSYLRDYLYASPKFYDIAGDSTLEIACTYGVISSSDHGLNWISSNNKIISEEIYGLQFLPDGKIVCSTSFGIFTKSGKEEFWIKKYPLTGFVSSRILRRDGSNNIFTTEPGGGDETHQPFSLKSTDGGDTWNYDTLGISNVPVGGGYFASQYYIDELGCQHYGISATSKQPIRLYKKDISKTWVIDTLGIDETPNKNQYQYKIFTNFGSNGSDFLYYASFRLDSSQYSGASVFRIQNDQKKWVLDTVGIHNIPIFSFASDNKGNFYAGSSTNGIISSIYKRSDSGWKAIKVPPAAVSDVIALACDSSGTLYAQFGPYFYGSYRGIFSTSDDGETWFYSGLDSINIRGLVGKNDSMYAFTNRGAYKLTRATLKLPVLSISQKVLDFHQVPENETKDTTIIIGNTGNDTLRVFNISSNNSAFTVPVKAFSVAPGSFYELHLVFSPYKNGIHSGLLRISTNTYPDSISVIGEGIDFKVPLMKISHKEIDFGKVTGGVKKDSMVYIKNIGTDTLRVTNVKSFMNTFQVNKTNFSIIPGDSAELTISFKPAIDGIVNSLIKVYGNNVSTDSIKVMGDGVKVLYPKLKMSLKSIDFGIIDIGQTKDSSVAVYNTGTDTLIISKIESTNEIFKINTEKMNLPPDSIQFLVISFIPDYQKTESGIINFTANTEPDSINLYGKGNKPQIVFDDNITVDFKVFPIPTSGILNFISKFSKPSSLDLQLLNMLGQSLMHHHYGLQNELNEQIHLDNLPCGIYLLNITIGSKTQIYKIVKE